MAIESGCSTDPYHYRKIFEQLEPFKKAKLTIESVREVQNIIRSAHRSNIISNFISSKDLVATSSYPFFDTLKKVSRALDPEIDFALVFQKYDEYLMIPRDSRSKQSYNNISDIFESNSKFNSTYYRYKDQHSLLTIPTTFIAVPHALPVFGSNRLTLFHDIMLPTGKNGLLASQHGQKEAALKSPKWNEKMQRAVFRGRTTGINFRQAKEHGIDVRISPRLKLHEMAMKQKSKELNCSVELDFGITDFWQFNGDQAQLEELKTRFPLASSMKYENQFKHKYLVIVDGNGWPDRVATFLLSGSLVFLSTVHEEWVSDQLIPGKHYIKIKPDLSDLIEKIEWAAGHDEEAKTIAEAGKKYAIENLDLKNIQIYNAFLMMEYQRLFL